jgi:hypothetical protein
MMYVCNVGEDDLTQGVNAMTRAVEGFVAAGFLAAGFATAVLAATTEAGFSTTVVTACR